MEVKDEGDYRNDSIIDFLLFLRLSCKFCDKLPLVAEAEEGA